MSLETQRQFLIRDWENGNELKEILRISTRSHSRGLNPIYCEVQDQSFPTTVLPTFMSIVVPMLIKSKNT